MHHSSRGRIPVVVNAQHKVQLNRISHVYLYHLDLDKFDQFARDFGFTEVAREQDTIYYSGYGRDMCIYVARRSKGTQESFGGAAFVAQTEEDFIKASKLNEASPVSPNEGPGGGSIVTITSPSGTQIHVVWGLQEKPVPSSAVSETEVHKGAYNTALTKNRKGEWQRFKIGPAMIHKLGHYGYVTAMFDEDVAFYTENFNFVPSDILWDEINGEEVDSLTFMHLDQGMEYSDHHTLFLSRAPPNFEGKHQMHHCSFEVEDFDTQLLGHQYLLSKSYVPIWGVGRHILGSQIFDYWRDPSGFAIEHYADGDLVNVDNKTCRWQNEGAASMYIWGPVRPEAGNFIFAYQRKAVVRSRPSSSLEPLDDPKMSMVFQHCRGAEMDLWSGVLQPTKNVTIFEKDVEVCEDPRGIVVNGDAVRISYQIGIGEGLTKRIGKDIGVLNFHRGNFRTRPFMSFDLKVDWAEQAVSNNITQFQPNYEREIRKQLSQNPNCDFRGGCEVIGREEGPHETVVEYKTGDGALHLIRTSWLVGADGKRGVVRKVFLESEGIRQEDGEYSYMGTWVAANLHVTTPTPESHPDFPLWRLGYKAEQVQSIFWPSGFHFCNDSRRPAVSGRFGPHDSGFWRHEYSVEPEDTLEDVEQDFWAHFRPWLSIPGSFFSEKLKGATIEFAAKIVNRWYCRKTMLIGDAAHVFPPFGGQGIATGIRDAQGLAWRLSIMSKLDVDPEIQERIMAGWSQERRHAWNAAAQATKLNGSIVNQRSFFGGLIYRACMRVLWWFPNISRFRTQRAFRDKLVYNTQTCPEGFFLQGIGVGRKIAQIWVQRLGEKPKLSDEVFIRNISHLSLLVFVRGQDDGNIHDLETVLQRAAVPKQVLTLEDVTFVRFANSERECSPGLQMQKDNCYYPCTTEHLLKQRIHPIQGYRETAVQDRFSKSAKYVLIRPDFFVHSVAADLPQLSANLEKVTEYFVGARRSQQRQQQRWNIT
ncbi:hypothetical protein AYO22_07329 [Fonsecaea multimorphosa]|nr:hypothetical protein AYO22_07329 [Fonsecaea multimorphosa]